MWPQENFRTQLLDWWATAECSVLPQVKVEAGWRTRSHFLWYWITENRNNRKCIYIYIYTKLLWSFPDKVNCVQCSMQLLHCKFLGVNGLKHLYKHNQTGSSSLLSIATYGIYITMEHVELLWTCDYNMISNNKFCDDWLMQQLFCCSEMTS